MDEAAHVLEPAIDGSKTDICNFIQGLDAGKDHFAQLVGGNFPLQGVLHSLLDLGGDSVQLGHLHLSLIEGADHGVGFSLSLQNTLKRFGVQECGGRFQVLASASVEDLDERLSRPKSPEFVVIDSFQYLQISYRRYIAFKEAHRNKLIILVSHADGKQPAGRAAKSVKYDASLKIWVEGYKAFSKGRFIGPTGEAVIWEKGAAEYWGDNSNEIENEDYDGTTEI